MVRKIITVNGSGIKDITYLTYMLQLSKYYDTKGIDLLNLFNTFSGVSSGSIIASTFVLREKFLKNIAKYNPEIIIAALNKINSNYLKDEKTDIVRNLKSMTVTNCSSIVIATLIVFFEKETSNIFHRSTLRKIVSINGMLFSKYDDNKKKIFNQYFNYTLKDIPSDRTLIIKSINVKKIKIQVYTNYVTSIKNDFIINNANQRISEAIHYSTNTPSYFPYNNMIDSGIILNTFLLEQTIIFKDDDLITFKLSNIIQPTVKKDILFDGIAGWIHPLLKIAAIDGYENEILKDLLQFKYQEKIHTSEFDLTAYSIDDSRNISKLKNIGRNKSLQSAVTFINRELVIDISKMINTWKDTWKLIKSESKGPSPSTIVACEYGILINLKFTDDNKLYVINNVNNVTNDSTEIYIWNYDNERMTLSYKIGNDNIEQKVIRLNDKALIIGDENECNYYERIINTEYIVAQLATSWLLLKQEKNGKDDTFSLNHSYILTMTINADFTVIYTKSDQPVESKGTWTLDFNYNQLIIKTNNNVSTTNNDNESLSSSEILILTIISLTTNELKIMQKNANVEIINTYTNGSISISTINGLVHMSKYENVNVKTRGIVTVKKNDGFFIQDGTNNSRGSCGLYIYTRANNPLLTSVSIGDLINVNGTIKEYGVKDSLTVTQMTSIKELTIETKNNPLPEPLMIGKKFNNFPSLNIDNGDINDFDPRISALDYWENYENMLVTLDMPNVVGQQKKFNSFYVTIDMQNINRRSTKYGGVLLNRGGNSDVIQCINVLMPKDPFFYSVFPGDTISHITGVLEYNTFNSVFRILPRNTSDFGIVTKGEISTDITNVRGTSNPPAYRSKEDLSDLDTPHISFMSTNQFNLQFKVNEIRVSNYIRINLKSPHIICVQEIQDDNGNIDDGTVNSDNVLNKLIDLLNSSIYDTYSLRKYNFIYVPPENNQDGGEKGANIRVAIIYDTITFNPQVFYRIGLNEQTDAFINTRKPLYAQFLHKETNDVYHIINVHNKSKLEDTQLWGKVQPPIQYSLPQRLKQVTYLKSWILNNLNKETDNIILAGDFNDYEWSESMKVFDDNTEQRFMKNIVNDIREDERYSYQYLGTYQTLDHIIVSSNLYNKIQNAFDTRIDIPKKPYATFPDVLSTQYWIESLGEPLLVDHNPFCVRIPY